MLAEPRAVRDGGHGGWGDVERAIGPSRATTHARRLSFLGIGYEKNGRIDAIHGSFVGDLCTAGFSERNDKSAMGVRSKIVSCEVGVQQAHAWKTGSAPVFRAVSAISARHACENLVIGSRIPVSQYSFF